MSKTYFLIDRPQFNAMLIAESGLQAELFGTNGNNGRLVEVTPDAGRISNNGQKVIYKTSAEDKEIRTINHEEVAEDYVAQGNETLYEEDGKYYKTWATYTWARMPAGTPQGKKPSDILTEGDTLVWVKAQQGDNLGQRPPGPPANPGKPARGLRAIVMTHEEVTVELEKPEWLQEEQI